MHADIKSWWNGLSSEERLFLDESWTNDYKKAPIDKMVEALIEVYSQYTSAEQLDSASDDEVDIYEHSVSHERFDMEIQCWFGAGIGYFCISNHYGMQYHVSVKTDGRLEFESFSGGAHKFCT
ncbi:hypothetical protein [Hahella chejuensis]|uniref:hypothetical protein n=1 Tax=Hahella chejuensis TaxID=158327 RepID=UPI0011D167BF|nr:hypothetical protein [Hahella chejuensis]